MDAIPCFLDFEASSLASASYPIEVAWTLADGSIESYLISPSGINKWTDWSAKSERLHGITQRQLLAEGQRPAWICQRMNEQLAGKTVYSDEPDYDNVWLTELFSVSWGNTPTFTLASVNDILASVIHPKGTDQAHFHDTLDAMKTNARKRVPQRHRAAWDVQYLVEIWRLANRHYKWSSQP